MPQPSHAPHIFVDSVSFSYPDRRVLTNVSFTVSAGERACLIGENGSGKSTLLKIAAGLLEPGSGAVHLRGADPSERSVGLLHQAPPFAPTYRISQAIETAVAPIRRSLITLDGAAQDLALFPQDQAVASAYAHALGAAERLEAWDVDSRIATVLAGLGLANIAADRQVRTLSGGQQARLSLAWLLLRAPEVLLLDEPTNHLDDNATEFLRRMLATWRGPVLMASHDRAFLDDNVTSLIDLDPAPIAHALKQTTGDAHGATGVGVVQFTGTFTNYLQARADQRERWELQYRDEQAAIKKMRAAVGENQQVGHVDWKPRSESRMAKKFYADRNAKVVARRVNDSRSRLELLEADQIVKPPVELKFAGIGAPAAQPIEHTEALILTRAAVAGRLNPVSVNLETGKSLLVTGANGTGKSTLLKLIAGQIAATSGAVTVHSSLRIGLLTQDVFIADPYGRGETRTALEAYVDNAGPRAAQDTPLASLGLLHPRDQLRPLAALSLGQKRRLELAILLASPPDLLLLDEPTNHLSLGLVTDLERALLDYPGTVIIASHDRWLRKRWAGQTLNLN